MNPFLQWIDAQGWTPFEFQREAWRAYADGCSGLIHAATGAGKTLAAWGGPIIEWFGEASAEFPPSCPLRALWITPLRALANDTAQSLREPVQALDMPWSVELRTGDTPQSVRRRQRERLPTALITTPESLSILLSYPGSSEQFTSLRLVIVDEWHELLGAKRGVQTELCLARLRSLAPRVRTWGLSATLGNIEEALDALVPAPSTGAGARCSASRKAHASDCGPAGDGTQRSDAALIRSAITKRIEIETLLPDSIERFPWSGHLGTKLRAQVIERIGNAKTTLLFTNTRSQAEIWFRELILTRPDWLESIAIHHGSIDREVRERVESRLREGALRCVVCTSSLDLGVDFLPVEQVMQLGSPKGIARLMQRAGRSGHQPGAVSRIIGIPTNAFELIEFAAARDAVAGAMRLDVSNERETTRVVAHLARNGQSDSHACGFAGVSLEHRTPLDRPLDVLAQHLVTLGVGDGFDASDMLREVRSTRAYRNLSHREWQWTLDFISRGGESLRAYPQYAKVLFDEDRFARVESKQIARTHRMMIGTITSDSAIRVRMRGGATLGTIEERFISRLRRGEKFFFSGRLLELLHIRDMTAWVRPATRAGRGNIPRWMGGRSPLSTQLARGVRARLQAARDGRFDTDEMRAIRPILELQRAWSKIPETDELLIERSPHRGINHIFIFSFAGRLVHEGLTALVGWRISQMRPCSMSMSSNDYGFELQSRDPLDFSDPQWREILSPANLLDDLLASMNATELARRRFRDIARIAGLVLSGYPGQGKTQRQLQASSDLFFDVFREFDPENLLLAQAQREVLERELEFSRMKETFERLAQERITIIETKRFSPLAFPLWTESIRTQEVSSESWQVRVQRMVEELERAAEPGAPAERRERRARRTSTVECSH